jgi:hypothetical protein
MDTALHAGLRWLPLAGWPRPACPALPARVAEITTLVRCPTVPGQASIRMFIRKGTGINCQADQNISLQNSRSKP